jgi:hypothetical protein
MSDRGGHSGGCVQTRVDAPLPRGAQRGDRPARRGLERPSDPLPALLLRILAISMPTAGARLQMTSLRQKPFTRFFEAGEQAVGFVDEANARLRACCRAPLARLKSWQCARATRWIHSADR